MIISILLHNIIALLAAVIVTLGAVFAFRQFKQSGIKT
jgi:predicted negative regulator of RcsB-dependent stress response